MSVILAPQAWRRKVKVAGAVASICWAPGPIRDELYTMYAIEVTRGAEADLKQLRRYYRALLLDAIEAHLRHHPTQPARNRKLLEDLSVPWESEDPVWELRVGDYRVFHDTDAQTRRAYVRAVRHKPPGRTREDIL